jgi:F-type H+-transporting ATPase subunit b
VLAVVAFASPAWAADAHDAAHEKPELIAPNVAVAVATIVVFFLLLLVLKKTAWKPILSGLKAREDAIRAQIEGAERANAEAKALLEEHQRRMAASNEEARHIVEEGRKDAESLRARIQADATVEAAKERERALREIDIAKHGAMKELYDQVASLATDVAGRILGQRLDPAGHRKLVDEAVTSFESSRKKPGARA